MTRFVPFLGAGVLALLLAACGSAGPSVAPQTLSPDSPAIVARDLKFTAVSVTAPAGKPFAIDFENGDTVPHNVSIYDTKGATMFKGELFSGAARRVYSVAALTPGAYVFKCDVHPDMVGALLAQ